MSDDWQEVPLDNNNDDWESIPLNNAPKESNIITDAQDLGLGATQGLLLGGADELVGGLKAGYDVVTGQADPTKDLSELYRKYQQIQEQKFNEAKERSPYLYGTGEIGGAIGTGLLTGGAGLGAKAATMGLKEAAAAGLPTLGKELGARALLGAAEAAPLGIAQGALSSEQGALIGATPEQKEQLLSESLYSGATASVLGAGMKGISSLLPKRAAGEAVEGAQRRFVDDSPFVRQAKQAYEMGEQGINLASEKAKLKGMAGADPLAKMDHKATEDLMGRIIGVDEDLGRAVGASLEDAASRGVKVDIGDELRRTADSLDRFFDRVPGIDTDPAARKAYMKMLIQPGERLNPMHVKSAMDEMEKVLGHLEGDTSFIANKVRDDVMKFRNGLRESLVQSVPSYASAAKRFAEFRDLVPETIINGPSGIKPKIYGSLKNKEEQLYKSTRSLIEGATRAGDAYAPESEKLVNLMASLNALESKNPSLLKKMGFNSAQDAEDLIKGYADRSATISQSMGVNPQGGATFNPMKGGPGLITTGRGGILNVANKAGLYGKPVKEVVMAPVNLSKRLYTATDDSLRTVASQLKGVPGLKNIGEALEKGLNNKDVAAKNASLFIILQSPEARKLLNDESDVTGM